ncbi:MAG: type III-A CRISPR-associated protein Csm2 [Aggregatilineales bacterium]
MMSEVTKIIQQNDAHLLVSFSERKGKDLAKDVKGIKATGKGLTRAQIRNVFSQVRQIEAMWQSDNQREQAYRSLLLLIPRLVPRLEYQAARGKPPKEDGLSGIERLRDMLVEAVKAVFDNSPSEEVVNLRFHRFVEFVESLLAYHRTVSEEQES